MQEKKTENRPLSCTVSLGSAGSETEYSYEYDDNGNITSVTYGNYTTNYYYDSANQLIREDNQRRNYTQTWEYDNAGNIVKHTKYSYTTAASLTGGTVITYAYGKNNWGDLMTGYVKDGKNYSITYDDIGNPTKIINTTDDPQGQNPVNEYTWQHGRQLKQLKRNGVTWTYTYDANGMRTSRSNGTTTYNYVYNGSQLVQMTMVNNSTGATQTMDYTYDASGRLLSLIYQSAIGATPTVYYYVTNIQGDVIGITDSEGTLLMSFHYDAYGTAVYTSHDPIASTLAQVSPFGYRGYVMDTGTGLYYLQSRYYDTAWGRFINADAFATTGQGLLSNNMFAYCLNNPVMFSDPSGTSSHNAAEPWLCDCASCNTSTAVTYYYYFNEENDADGFWETINNHFIMQQETEILIIMQQTKLIQQGACAVWDAYVLSNKLQMDNQTKQDYAVIRIGELFKENPLYALDVVAGAVSFGSWYIEGLVLMGVFSIPYFGQVALWTIGGIATAWTVYRLVDNGLSLLSE